MATLQNVLDHGVCFFFQEFFLREVVRVLTDSFFLPQPSTFSTIGTVAVPHMGIDTLIFISGGQLASDMVQLSGIIYTWV